MSMFVVAKNPVNTQWEIFFEGTYLKWRGGDSNNNTICTSPSSANWHFVVGTQSGTNTALYIDGIKCTTGSTTAIGNGTDVINIGRFSSPSFYYFNGLIDDVRIYSRVLSPAEISAIYNATK